MNKRIKKCESCTQELSKITKCMTCEQEAIMKAKVEKVMHEFKEHTLHGRSKDNLVTSREQAVAIALSQGRKAAGVAPKRRKQPK